MTAEIAVINKSAVALAADSKVTLSNGGSSKTYDTVDKIFTLSKSEPVGAMIYGSAEFIGFPWETIIKSYRQSNFSRKFPKIFDWAEDFRNYLTNFFPFTDDDEIRVARRIAESWVNVAVNSALHASRGLNEFSECLTVAINENTSAINNFDYFLTDSEWNELLPKIDKELNEICSRGIMTSFRSEQSALRSFAELGIRKSAPSPGATGLVIAGFGSDELLPSLEALHIDGIIAGRLKYIESHNYDMTRWKSAVVIPFAQTDMVDRFMQGIDPQHANLLHTSVAQLVYESSLQAVRHFCNISADDEGVQESLQAAAGDAAQKFWDAHERQRRIMFADPIIDMVGSLPKDELANVAESLVSLTSLQRRVSRELETVGGAVDVAVISKGDGFVWIKRKHYFSPDRNLRFVQGYFRDQMGGQSSEESS